MDALSTIAQIGTFVVIAATAVAALVQLSHLRSANMVAAFITFLQEYEGPQLRDAFHFVRTDLSRRLEDSAFRQEIRDGELDRAKHAEIMVCNFFDQWGGFYRQGVIDRSLFMRHHAGIVVAFWARLEPVIALSVSPRGSNTAFEDFEYLTVQARAWEAAHPKGDYPAGVPRIPLTDPWRDRDEKNG